MEKKNKKKSVQPKVKYEYPTELHLKCINCDAHVKQIVTGDFDDSQFICDKCTVGDLTENIEEF